MFSALTHLFTPSINKSLWEDGCVPPPPSLFLFPLLGLGLCPRLPQGAGGECGDAGRLPPKFTPATTRIVFLALTLLHKVQAASVGYRSSQGTGQAES